MTWTKEQVVLRGQGSLFEMVNSKRFQKCFDVPITSKMDVQIILSDRLPSPVETQAYDQDLVARRRVIHVFRFANHILALSQTSPSCARVVDVGKAWRVHQPMNQWGLLKASQKNDRPVELATVARQALLCLFNGLFRKHALEASNRLFCFSLAHHTYEEIPVYPTHLADAGDHLEIALKAAKPSSSKVRSDNYRLNPLPDMEDFLRANTHPHFGLIQKKVTDLQHRYYTPVLTTFMEYSNATGHDLSFNRSCSLAILEALERIAGATPRKSLEKTTCGFDSLADPKVDPLQIGLIDHYDHPCNHFFPDYHPGLAISWTKAYSLTKNREIWLASQFAYHDPKYLELPAMVFDTSNGCAAGSHLYEALFYGLLEVIERDAFNLVWFNRLACTRISLDSIENLEFQMLVDLLHRDGDQVHVFQLITDVPVPVVLVIVQRGGEKPGGLTIGSCAHPDPEKAIHNALIEALYHFPKLEATVSEHGASLREKAADFNKVEELPDHYQVFALPEMSQHVAFLFKSEPKPLEAVAFPVFPKHERLAEDVSYLVDWLQKNQYDVVVHSQTSPEQRQLGLHTLKVLIPGFLPVSFGANRQRVAGLPRLREVPVKLGLFSKPKAIEDMNKVPHPMS